MEPATGYTVKRDCCASRCSPLRPSGAEVGYLESGPSACRQLRPERLGTDNHQIGTTFWGDGSVLGNHEWHRVDVYVKYGATDGEARLFEDGVQLWEAVGVDTVQSPAGIAPFYVMSNWSSNPGWEHDANNHVYWDEFEVFSDSATGTPTVGSLADASVHL